MASNWAEERVKELARCIVPEGWDPCNIEKLLREVGLVEVLDAIPGAGNASEVFQAARRFEKNLREKSGGK